MFLFDLETNTRKIIFTTKRNIGWPSYKNHTILFSCEYNGFEEIFLYDIKSKKTFIVSNHKLGSYYPVFQKRTKIYITRRWGILVSIFIKMTQKMKLI